MRVNVKAFSLIELLTALFIVSIMVISLTTIYDSSIKAIGAIDEKLEDGFDSTNILHLIVDDVARVSSLDTDTTFALKSKTIDGVMVYRLEIIGKIYDNDGKEMEYKKVVWQSDYDYLSDTTTLYRCEAGMGVQDPLLGTQQRENEGSEIFVPVCSGLTHFSIQVPSGNTISGEEEEEYADSWEQDGMPGGIIVEMSFTPPVEYITGEVEVPLEDRVSRRISVNRSRQYRFEFIPKDLDAAYGYDDEEELIGEDGEEIIDDEEFEKQLQQDQDGQSQQPQELEEQK